MARNMTRLHMQNRPKRPVLHVLFILVLLLAGCRPAASAGIDHNTRQPIPDPLNASPRDASLNLRELPALEGDSFRFLVVGHAYGGIHGEDTDPARHLLEKLPALAEMDLSLLVSLGDMVKQSEADDFEAFDRQLLQPAAFPVFNTVGNHDVENRAEYESRYGATYYSFNYGPARMIFLDTERAECAIDVPQQEMLAQALAAAEQDPQTRQIFIFMHKTLFFQNERLAELRHERAGPNVWDCYGLGNFPELLTNLIQHAAAHKPVYVFAGDVGAFANLSPYYQRDPHLPLTYLMTGMGDAPTDSALLVTVDGDEVQLEALSLTEEPLAELESFTVEYWIAVAEGE